ncbi:MAG TPA: CHAT domain-containing tetratricopeptide repeat protein [Pirellulales bacterium]|nr:CHAT domain-containing tetratricopeptide repeat protein [Pirellulales bacterium]
MRVFVGLVLLLGALAAEADEPSPPNGSKSQLADLTETQRAELTASEKLEQQAGAFFNDGKFEGAIELLDQVLDTQRRILGPRSGKVAATLHFLGANYQNLRDYARAEPLFRQALDIRGEVHGKSSFEYAVTLSLLAELYRQTNNDALAEPLFLEAHEAYQKSCGDTHPFYAGNLAWMATMYADMGRADRAEPMLKEALAVRKKLLGEKDPMVAVSLDQLGWFYHGQGRYDEAEPLYQQALEIYQETGRVEHPNYAMVLRELGSLYLATGNFAQAEVYLWQALDLRRKIWNPRHFDNVTLLCDLALAHRDAPQALRLSAEAMAIALENLGQNFDGQSEQQQLARAANLRVAIDTCITIAAESGHFTEDVYDAWLQYKGLVLRHQKRWHRQARAPELKPLFDELRQTTAELACLALAARDDSQAAADREAEGPRRIAELSAAKQRIEQELARRSAALSPAERPISVESLQAALPQSSVLVDFVAYKRPRMRARDEHGKTELFYRHDQGAFIVTRSGVRLVEIGWSDAVAASIAEWRGPAGDDLGRTPISANAANVLRQHLWGKIEPWLDGKSLVLISPDNLIGRIPFGALPGKEPGAYLIEEYMTVVVPSPALLPEMLADAPRRASGSNVLVVGDVDYGQAKADAPSSWMHLDGTRDELHAIAELARQRFAADSVSVLDGARASEPALRREAGSHRYLHLATHGFYNSERFRDSLARPLRRSTGTTPLASQQALGSFHPGLLSGLVFAGANEPATNFNDGYLTADEVATLDLGNLDLCVLSACETGLGRAQGSEGLLGLQRAFGLAGARTMIAGLWRVPDQATRTLMEQFYQRLWSSDRHMSKIEALHEAQLWMLREGAVDAGVRRGLTVEIIDAPLTSSRLPPLYWAAFVLSGDWR